MIGLKIKSIRQSKKITQKELAEAINRDRSIVAKYERNGINIPSNILPLIADALNVPIAKLFEL